MADEHLGAQLLQPFGIGAGLGVGPLHRIAGAHHDLGDAAHADAPDADEVHGADFEGDGATGHVQVDSRKGGAAEAFSLIADSRAGDTAKRLNKRGKLLPHDFPDDFKPHLVISVD